MARASKAPEQAPDGTPSLYQLPMGEATLATTERALLGACILSADALNSAKALDPEDMYHPHHRALLRLLRRFAQSNKPYDLTLLAEYLDGDAEELAACGGSLAQIANYADDVPSTAIVPAYVRAIQDSATRRRIRSLGSAISEELCAAAGDRRIDISDAVAKARARLAAALPGHTQTVETEGPEADVFRLLSISKEDRNPRPTLSNLFTVFRDDSRWRSLRLNMLGNNLEYQDGKQPHEALFLATTARWLATHYGLEAGGPMIQSALLAAAQGRAYNPVQEYLDRLVWDGVSRLDSMRTDILGCPPPAEGDFHKLHNAYLRRFAIGAVARAMKPGCKMDTALILVGAQGAKKSTFFAEWFGRQWFGDSPIPIGDKDAFIQLQTVWGYEAAEMEDLGRKTAEAVKQFLSAGTDVYRAPYDREARHHPRHSVMMGSANRQQILTDETGSRRFWPITIPDNALIDIPRLLADRDQLWAEATAAFRKNEPWWFTREEETALERAKDVEQYELEDAWYPEIIAWVNSRGNAEPFQIVDIFNGLKLDHSHRNKTNQERVGAILRRMKCTQDRLKNDQGQRLRVWYPPPPEPPKIAPLFDDSAPF